MREGKQAAVSAALVVGFLAVAWLQVLVAVLVVVQVLRLLPGSVAVQIAVPLTIATGGVLWFATVRALRLRHRPPAGVRVTRHDAPALWQMIDAAAAAAGVTPPDGVTVVADATATLAEQLRLGGLRGGRRDLLLGLPLLLAWDEARLRAVVAHELAHASPRLGRFAPMARRGRVAISRIVPRIPRRSPTGPVLRAYARWFHAVDAPLARAQELAADQIAASFAGLPAAAAVLRDGPALDGMQQLFHAEYLSPGWQAGYMPDDIFGGFLRVLAARADEMARLRATDPPPSPPGDAHAALAERWGALLASLPAPSIPAVPGAEAGTSEAGTSAPGPEAGMVDSGAAGLDSGVPDGESGAAGLDSGVPDGRSGAAGLDRESGAADLEPGELVRDPGVPGDGPGAVWPGGPASAGASSDAASSGAATSHPSSSGHTASSGAARVSSSAPAGDLVPDLPGLGRALQAVAFPPAGREVVGWDEFFGVARFAEMEREADAALRALSRAAGQPVSSTGEVLDLAADGDLRKIAEKMFAGLSAEQTADRIADLITLLFALAALTNGVARWRHSWTGTAELVAIDGSHLDLAGPAALAADPATVGAARKWLADMGIDLAGSAGPEQRRPARVPVLGGVVNVLVDGARTDLLVVETGLVLVPGLPRSRYAEAKRRLSRLAAEGVLADGSWAGGQPAWLPPQAPSDNAAARGGAPHGTDGEQGSLVSAASGARSQTAATPEGSARPGVGSGPRIGSGAGGASGSGDAAGGDVDGDSRGASGTGAGAASADTVGAALAPSSKNPPETKDDFSSADVSDPATESGSGAGTGSASEHATDGGSGAGAVADLKSPSGSGARPGAGDGVDPGKASSPDAEPASGAGPSANAGPASGAGRAAEAGPAAGAGADPSEAAGAGAAFGASEATAGEAAGRTAVDGSRFVPFADVKAAAVVRGRRGWEIGLHDGRTLSVRAALDSDELPGGWAALDEAVDFLARTR